MENGSKGNKGDVSMFKKCRGKDNIIGHKMIEGGRKINRVCNLICMCGRPLAPNFKRERPANDWFCYMLYLVKKLCFKMAGHVTSIVLYFWTFRQLHCLFFFKILKIDNKDPSVCELFVQMAISCSKQGNYMYTTIPVYNISFSKPKLISTPS